MTVDVELHRIWITGFRSYELGVMGTKDPKLMVIKYALRKILENAIQDGTDWLITGGQLGIEQWAIEVALELRDEAYPEFQIALMTPFSKFGSQWNEANAEKLTQLKSSVNFTSAVSQGDFAGRNQMVTYQNFMLTHTDEAVIFFDEEATESKARYDDVAIHDFAENHDYPVRRVDLDRLQDYATEYQETLWED